VKQLCIIAHGRDNCGWGFVNLLVSGGGTLKPNPSQTERLMKKNMKWFTGALAIVGGLAIVNSVRAQSVVNFSTINPSTLSSGNSDGNALYAGWATATITSQPTGLEFNSSGYGSGHLQLSTPLTLNANDTIATLTLTINSYGGDTGVTASGIYTGLPFVLDDSLASPPTLGGYSGPGNAGNDPGASWSGNVVTLTQALSSAEVTAIQTGNDVLTGFNLEVDPASDESDPYDITFNSLVLSPAAVPEPASMALAGVGAACFMFLRRRK
jgi:hypothetical protein